MTTMDETNTSIVKKKSLNLRALFCESFFTSKFLIMTFLNVHTRKKLIPLAYVYHVR